MKFLTLTSTATILSAASATVLIYATDVYKQGQTYEVPYLLDRPYTLSLELIRKIDTSNARQWQWQSVKVLFENLEAKPCNGSYIANVDATWPTSENGEEYAFYITGTDEVSESPFGIAGFADSSDWFTIERNSTVGRRR